MNRDSEERKIEALFHEIREEDRRLAPSFARSWEAARARLRQTPAGWPVFRLAAAAALAGVLACSAFLLVRQAGRKPTPPEQSSAGHLPDRQPIGPRVPEAMPLPAPPPAPPRKVTPVRKASEPRGEQLQPQEILISKWRSPTEFLLKSSGDGLMKSVPDLRGSVVKIESTMLYEKN